MLRYMSFTHYDLQRSSDHFFTFFFVYRGDPSFGGGLRPQGVATLMIAALFFY